MLYTHSPVKANKRSCWTDKKHLTKLWSTAGFLSLPHMYQCKQSGNFPSLLHLSPKCNISQPMYFFEFFNDSINQHTLSTSPEVSCSPKPPFSPWKTFVISNLFQSEASIGIYQHLPTCTCRLIISWHQEEYLVLHWLLSRFLKRNLTVCKPNVSLCASSTCGFLWVLASTLHTRLTCHVLTISYYFVKMGKSDLIDDNYP